jgi:hypothetical protein
MILHDVADDAEFVEVPTPALGPERLGEGDQNAGDVVSVPVNCGSSVNDVTHISI